MLGDKHASDGSYPSYKMKRFDIGKSVSVRPRFFSMSCRRRIAHPLEHDSLAPVDCRRMSPVSILKTRIA